VSAMTVKMPRLTVQVTAGETVFALIVSLLSGFGILIDDNNTKKAKLPLRFGR
jgi:hypothetical protein